MKSFKTKILTAIGGVGALCVLCCTLPIMGMLGLGAIEVFFCENRYLQGFGMFLMGGSVFLLFQRKFQNLNLVQSCSVKCGCQVENK